MKYYVYFNYDYDYVGLEMFDEKQKALDFISEKLREHRCALSDFTLIEGRVLVLKAQEVVTLVVAEPFQQ